MLQFLLALKKLKGTVTGDILQQVRLMTLLDLYGMHRPQVSDVPLKPYNSI